MARIPLGTSGGRMPQVAMQLESENRQDERQKRQLRVQQSQFFASLAQRQSEQRERSMFQEKQMAMTEEKQLLNQMSDQIREEGMRQQRSFGQAAKNVELGGRYGAQVKWNPATQQFDAQPVQEGQGFAVAKSRKAQEKAAELQQQAQGRTAQIMAAYPEFSLLEPETVNAMVMSSRTDNQLMDEIDQLAEKRASGEARLTLSDKASSPEQVIDALETLKSQGAKTLWDHALEAEVDARVESFADKNMAEKGLDKQRAQLVSLITKAKAVASRPPPRGFDIMGKNEKAIAAADLRSYNEQLAEVDKAILSASTQRRKRVRDNPYQKVMADVIKEVYSGQSGVHEVHQKWSENIQGAVQGLQQNAEQAMTQGGGAGVAGVTQPPGETPQQPQPSQKAQPSQQGLSEPPEAQEAASGMREFLMGEINRIKAGIDQAQADVAEAEKSGDDRVIAETKNQLMRALRERDSLIIQYGLRTKTPGKRDVL